MKASAKYRLSIGKRFHCNSKLCAGWLAALRKTIWRGAISFRSLCTLMSKPGVNCREQAQKMDRLNLVR